MEMETIEKVLPVELSDDELKVKASELTTALRKKNSIEADKKAVMAEFKNKIEDVAVEIADLTTIVHEKKERRPVKCYIKFNYERSIVETVRSDYGEVVESRSMTIAERQQKLQFLSD